VQGIIDIQGADGPGVKTRQLLQATLPPIVTNPDPVAAGELTAFCLVATCLGLAHPNPSFLSAVSSDSHLFACFCRGTVLLNSSVHWLHSHIWHSSLHSGHQWAECWRDWHRSGWAGHQWQQWAGITPPAHADVYLFCWGDQCNLQWLCSDQVEGRQQLR